MDQAKADNVDMDSLSRLLKIKAAAIRWINADFAFRCGRHAYSAQATNWLLEAEDDLRKAVTGKRLLKNARRVLDERKAKR